jgi:hypothetical protein
MAIYLRPRKKKKAKKKKSGEPGKPRPLFG